MSSIIASREPPSRAHALDGTRHVVELGEPQALRQAAGRVDGEDDDAAARLGGPDPEGGGGRRLADAAGPAADDDPRGRVGEQGVDVERLGRRRGGARHQRAPCRASSSARTETPPSSMPEASAGRRDDGEAEPGDVVLEGALERDPRGVVVALGEQPGDGPARWPGRRRRRGRRAPAPRPGRRRWWRARGGPRRRAGSRTWLTTTAPRPKPSADEVGDGVGGLLHRHLLEEGDDVDEGLAVLEHPGDRLGLGVDRADAREVGHLDVDREEAGDPSGGRGVEDDGVPRPCGPARASARGAPHGLVDLAGEEDVAHAGGDGRREVDDAHPLERPAGAAELVEGLEVLEERGLGVDRQPPQLAAAGVADEADLLGAERRDVEGLADALPALDLDEEDLAALPAQREGEGGGDGGLADAALAGDDVQAHAVEDPGERGVGHARQRRRRAASAAAGLSAG